MRASAAARWVLRRSDWYGRIAAGHARLAARRALAASGVPIRRDWLDLDCPDGDEASGLFSEAAAVVGCLDACSREPRLYAGMHVDFRDHGLYYEAAAGPNWWEYYFEPIRVGTPEDAVVRRVPDWQHDACAEAVELSMSRRRAADLVSRHVRVKAAMQDECDAFWRAQIGGRVAIGVHYRGTDKWEGAPVVPYETIVDAVRHARGSAAAMPDDFMVFLATDEQACVEHLRRTFADRLIVRDMTRSTDGRPLHKIAGDGFRKGKDAVLDCLLLARCAHLVRTDSDLGLFAAFFNPELPITMLGTPT